MLFFEDFYHFNELVTAIQIIFVMFQELAHAFNQHAWNFSSYFQMGRKLINSKDSRFKNSLDSIDVGLVYVVVGLASFLGYREVDSLVVEVSQEGSNSCLHILE